MSLLIALSERLRERKRGMHEDGSKLSVEQPFVICERYGTKLPLGTALHSDGTACSSSTNPASGAVILFGLDMKWAMTLLSVEPQKVRVRCARIGVDGDADVAAKQLNDERCWCLNWAAQVGG